jgi:hypothetical protein
MIEDTLVNYLILFIVLELYEVQWQKANTIIGMLARMYSHYAKNIFVFLLMHPTFYFAIMLMITSDYNTYAIALFLIKGIDIATKMILLKKVFIDKEVSEELTLALLAPLNRAVAYIGLFVYPPLIYMVFRGGLY